MGIAAVSLAVLPLLAGCSSLSSPSASAPPPNQAAGMPPPNTAAAAQPPYTPAQQQANAGGSTFLSMFRDPPSQDPNGYDARASTYPQQSLTDLFKGSTDTRSTPDPGGAGYPTQALIGSAGSAPAQQANVPRPPASYTASQQPYASPPPPAGQQAYAQPQTQPAYAPPPASPPADNTYASNGYPFPQRNLFDFGSSSQPQAQPQPQVQAMPHPPSSYTASGQPYAPPGAQPAGAAPGQPVPGQVPPPQAPAAQAPPSPEPATAGIYPQQSLSDLFKSGQ